jgi:hypothetical protein
MNADTSRLCGRASFVEKCWCNSSFMQTGKHRSSLQVRLRNQSNFQSNPDLFFCHKVINHSLSKNPRNRHCLNKISESKAACHFELVSESQTAGKEIAGQARNDSLQDAGLSPCGTKTVSFGQSGNRNATRAVQARAWSNNIIKVSYDNFVSTCISRCILYEVIETDSVAVNSNGGWRRKYGCKL